MQFFKEKHKKRFIDIFGLLGIKFKQALQGDIWYYSQLWSANSGITNHLYLKTTKLRKALVTTNWRKHKEKSTLIQKWKALLQFKHHQSRNLKLQDLLVYMNTPLLPWVGKQPIWRWNKVDCLSIDLDMSQIWGRFICMFCGPQ